MLRGKVVSLAPELYVALALKLYLLVDTTPPILVLIKSKEKVKSPSATNVNTDVLSSHIIVGSAVVETNFGVGTKYASKTFEAVIS